ncbi:unnamed protein product, partial [Prunus brigantina]
MSYPLNLNFNPDVMNIPIPLMAHKRKLKLHFCICVDVPKKEDSLKRRTSSLSRRESLRRDSKSPNEIIEICSQDSSADSPANASDYSAVPDLLREFRSQSGDARGGGKATMRRSTPRARDEAGPSRVPCCSCHFDHKMLLMERDLLKEDLACVSTQVTRLRSDLVDADRAMSAAHSDGIHDGFR